MNRFPNFVLLRAFEAAARLQSFTLAARELHVTQSAISHQVAELEAYFGHALFFRRHRRIELTPQAQRLQEALARSFDMIAAACEDVMSPPRAQVLMVHCAPSFAARWLGPRLPAFKIVHPGITIHLSSGPEPLDLTREQDVDLAISYAYALQRPGVTTVALGMERVAPLCAPALFKTGTNVRAFMSSATLIDSQLSRVTWPDWFKLNHMKLPVQPRPSFDRASLALSAAVDGMGVALESVRLAEIELTKGDLIELGEEEFAPLARETHFFSYRTSDKNQTKIKWFREWLGMEAGLQGPAD